MKNQKRKKKLTKRKRRMWKTKSAENCQLITVKRNKKPSFSCIKNSSDFKTIPLELAQK